LPPATTHNKQQVRFTAPATTHNKQQVCSVALATTLNKQQVRFVVAAATHNKQQVRLTAPATTHNKQQVRFVVAAATHNNAASPPYTFSPPIVCMNLRVFKLKQSSIQWRTDWFQTQVCVLNPVDRDACSSLATLLHSCSCKCFVLMGFAALSKRKDNVNAI